MSDKAFNDSADLETAAAVKAAFADVHMTRDLPVAAGDAAATQPVAIHRRRRWIAAASAAAASVAAIGLAVGPSLVGGSAAAWATVPAAPTAGDTASAIAECSVPYRGGDSQSRAGAPAVSEPVALQESTLTVLDVRGDGAVAIFSEGAGSYVCTLARVNGEWTFAGASGSDETSPAAAGVTAAMSTQLPDGTEFSSLHGYVDSAAVKVVVTLASGLEAEASIGSAAAGTPFAVWFPVAVGDLEGATISAVDGNGQVTNLQSPAVR
jgi:hypothetical protein